MLKTKRQQFIGLQWGGDSAFALVLSCPDGCCAPGIAAVCVQNMAVNACQSLLEFCDGVSRWLGTLGMRGVQVCTGVPMPDFAACIDTVPASMTESQLASYCETVTWRMGRMWQVGFASCHQVPDDESSADTESMRVMCGCVRAKAVDAGRELSNRIGGVFVNANSELLAVCNAFSKLEGWKIAGCESSSVVYVHGASYGLARFQGARLECIDVVDSEAALMASLEKRVSCSDLASDGHSGRHSIYLCGDCGEVSAVRRELQAVHPTWRALVFGISLDGVGVTGALPAALDGVHPELVAVYGLALQAMGVGVYAPEIQCRRHGETQNSFMAGIRNRTCRKRRVACLWCAAVLAGVVLGGGIAHWPCRVLNNGQNVAQENIHARPDQTAVEDSASENHPGTNARMKPQAAEDGKNTVEHARAPVKTPETASADNCVAAAESSTGAISKPEEGVSLAGESPKEAASSVADKRGDAAATKTKPGVADAMRAKNGEKAHDASSDASIQGKQAESPAPGRQKDAQTPEAENSSKTAGEGPSASARQEEICKAGECAVKYIGYREATNESGHAIKAWFIVHLPEKSEFKTWLGEGEDCSGVFTVKSISREHATVQANGTEIRIPWKTAVVLDSH